MTTGTATLGTAAKTLSFTNSSTGELVIGAITATGTGAAGSALTSFGFTNTGVNGAANTIAALNLNTGGSIGTYTYTDSASAQANTIAAITAGTISAMTITASADSAGSHTWATLANVGSIGNISVTTADTVAFTTGATAATSIGNITAAMSGTSAVVNLGTMGASGTMGDITVTGAGAFSMTAGAVLSVGTVSTAGVTSGTQTITLDAGTLIGTTMTGGAGVDVFTGTGGADTISTGAAGDTITGGLGADTLTGGAGSDDFVYLVADAGDTITDFTVGADDIDFNTALLSINGLVTAPTGYQDDAAGVAIAVTTSVFELEGSTTGGTAANLVTALGATATNAAIDAGDTLLFVNYLTAGGAQIWSFVDASGADVDAAELTLVATLTGVAADAMSSVDFI